MIPVGPTHFLVVSAIVFALGLGVIVTKRNAIAVLFGVELILNAAALNFIVFSQYPARLRPDETGGPPLAGQVVAIFVIILAAAEAAVALAIVLNLFHILDTIHVDEADALKE
ncbi:MAG: NADH-quinone oxidoreductase subunit NuoK [Planctomycetales bacterium]|nr:NADH-quinone oxidoreductase subunit NuoK [Planctomycetales bacterium]